jgi:5-methylcytosine-specific restriction endonuclease McrA
MINLTDLQFTKITASEIDEGRKSILLSTLPVCEICLRLFLADAYDKVNKGTQLDHIKPVNPDNALQSEGWGHPYDNDNLQLLCSYHHSKKSNRDKKVINKLKKK